VRSNQVGEKQNLSAQKATFIAVATVGLSIFGSIYIYICLKIKPNSVTIRSLS
jgi:hypothetical protein